MGGMPGMSGKSSHFNANFGGGYGEYGFTREEEEELLSQGVKPWEDDAHAVLAVLHGDASGGTDSEDDGSYGDDDEEEEGDEEDEEDDLIDVLAQALELGMLTLQEEEMLWNAVDNGETTEEELLAKWKPQVYAAASTPADDDDDSEPRVVEVEDVSTPSMGWHTALDGRGCTYYWNAETAASQYEKPPDFDPSTAQYAGPYTPPGEGSASSSSARSSAAWPPELQLWAERSFGACRNERDRGRCERELKERISAFKGNYSGHALAPAPPPSTHCPFSLCCWRTPLIHAMHM